MDEYTKCFEAYCTVLTNISEPWRTVKTKVMAAVEELRAINGLVNKAGDVNATNISPNASLANNSAN